MKIIYQLLFLALIVLSCTDHHTKADSNCGVNNPVEDLAWLKEEIERNSAASDLHDYFLYQGVYKGKTVFVMSICCPTCIITPPDVKDCQGRKVGAIGVDIDSGVLETADVIWKTSNGVCP